MKLKVAQIKNNDYLDAINEIMGDDIDADWSGSNGIEWGSDEAKQLGKPDNEIAYERLQNNRNESSVIDNYLQEYQSKFGGYYEYIEYEICYDEDRNPIALAVAFYQED